MFSLRRRREKLGIRKKMMTTMVNQTPLITAALREEEVVKPLKLDLVEKLVKRSVSVKLVAMVSVRRHKADATEIVKKVIKKFRPQRQSKGVVMQLVSTEHKDSKFYLMFSLKEASFCYYYYY